MMKLLWMLRSGLRVITSYYGPRKNPKTGKQELHDGIDIKCEVGTPILAVESGIVEFAGSDNLGGGTHIALYHNNLGIYSTYLHLSRLMVSKGQLVKQGDIIGYSGVTGNVTGPHLHFSLGTGLSPGKYIKDELSFNPLNVAKVEFFNYGTVLTENKKPLYSVIVVDKAGINARATAGGTIKSSYPYGYTIEIFATSGSWGQDRNGLWVSLTPACTRKVGEAVPTPLFNVSVICDFVNKRSGPSSIKYPITKGKYYRGEIVGIYRTSGDWGQDLDGLWLCITNKYVRRI